MTDNIAFNVIPADSTSATETSTTQVQETPTPQPVQEATPKVPQVDYAARIAELTRLQSKATRAQQEAQEKLKTYESWQKQKAEHDKLLSRLKENPAVVAKLLLESQGIQMSENEIITALLADPTGDKFKEDLLPKQKTETQLLEERLAKIEEERLERLKQEQEEKQKQFSQQFEQGLDSLVTNVASPLVIADKVKYAASYHKAEESAMHFKNELREEIKDFQTQHGKMPTADWVHNMSVDVLNRVEGYLREQIKKYDGHLPDYTKQAPQSQPQPREVVRAPQQPQHSQPNFSKEEYKPQDHSTVDAANDFFSAVRQGKSVDKWNKTKPANESNGPVLSREEWLEQQFARIGLKD